MNTIWPAEINGVTGVKSTESWVDEIETPKNWLNLFEIDLVNRFDLQMFAAEDEGRTEDPTDRRKREEREKGNVPKSNDLASAAVLLGTALTLMFTATYIYRQCIQVFKRYLGNKDLFMMNEAQLLQLLPDALMETAKIVGPVLIAAVLMGILGNVVQVGLLFTGEPLAFKPERMIPDFKRVLPNRRTLYNLGKTIVEVLVVGFGAYLLIVDDFIPMLKSANMGLAQAIGMFAWVAFKLIIVLAILFLGLSIVDYFYQRFEYIENLKMTISEAKRERKDDEGDPLIRQKQRDRSFELRRRRNMLEEVPKADVVITNPTHFAVALIYDPTNTTSNAPVVVAKGADGFAFEIRRVAIENNVPIQENPYLARMLYNEVEVGKEIPEQLYKVVSLVFAKLEGFQQKMRSANA